MKLTVVGIAGANGSRQALEALFRNLPNDSGVAFVVAARMGRRQVNQLPAQIQQRTNMPVVTAADGVTFQPDHIYVIPAGLNARFADGRLHLWDGPAQVESASGDGEQVQPDDTADTLHTNHQGLLDTFLASLAEEYGAEAVAILLSGTGKDGLAGLQRVQEAGGLVLIQDPNSAAHSALPRRAVAQLQKRAATENPKSTDISGNDISGNDISGNDISGNDISGNDISGNDISGNDISGNDISGSDTNGVAPIIENAGDLARQLVQQRGALRIDNGADASTSTQQFDQVYHDILTEIHRQTGHDLSHYKLSTLNRRIARRMQIAGIPSPNQYANYLQTHKDEAVALFKDSLVSVTSFFRDPDAYTMLEQDCVPQLFAKKGRGDYVRVWVAGCATGEEAYSVAIQLMEYASQLKEPPRFQVFATDLDEEAIAFARQGLYPATIAKDMTPTRFERFFTEEEAGYYRINTEVREHLLFAVHDLLKDPPFSRLDLICCRNVLIYFNREAQEKVFSILHYALNSNGYLFLGTSESVDSSPDLFSVVDKHCHLYQRRDVVNMAQRRLPTSTPTLQGRRTTEDSRNESEPPARTVEEIYTTWSLRTHTPARLLINNNYEITHMFGEVSRFFQDRDGAVSQNILDRVRPELRLDLQTSLYPAFQKNERTVSRLLHMELGEAIHLVQLHVGPVNEPGFPDNLIEVVFVIQDSAPLFSLSTTGESEHVDLALMTRMEEELMRTRERMQAVVEEYEDFSHELKTSNEELQSMNEELKSTTEELETSKEELQSMNEELVTLNGELNNKIDELNRANSDLMNFIASTDVGAIFLDQGLRISRFTPRATDLFNLIESDIHRPLAHITHRIHHPALADLAAHVRNTADHIEETVQSDDNRWYILRLFPYRTVENQIDGVVMTFVDISDLKRAESEERQRRQQQVLAELSRQALIGSELDALLQTATEQVAQVLGMAFCKVLELQPDNQSLLLRKGVGWNAGIVGHAGVPTDNGSQAGYTLEAQGPVVVRDLQTETRFQGPSLLTEHGVRSGISVTIYGPDGPYGVLGVHDREPRSFATYDVDFLQAVANTLAAAVTREAHTAQLQFQANILAQISDAVIAVDNQQRITYLNAAAADQYATDATSALGRPLSTLHTHQWLTADAETEAVQALTEKDSWRGENIHIRHDGLEIPVESTVSILTNRDEPVGMLAVIRDVTEQKTAEETLRRSEERYRYLFETMDEGFCVVEILLDEEGRPTDYRFLEGNPAFEEFTGLRDTIGKTARELVPGLEDHWVEIYGDVALTGEPIRFEQGSEAMGRWFNVYAFRVGDVEKRRVAILFNNITERKLMEDALRISEANARRHLDELETIYNSAPVGLCVLDTEFRWVRINERLAEMNGYSVAEHIGRTVRELLPEIADDTEPMLRRLLESGEPVRTMEISGETPAQPDVQRIWLESFFPLYDTSGQITGINIVTEEITERKAAERALRESEEMRRLALEGAQLGTWTIDLINGETFWDSRYREIFGLSTDEPASNAKRISLIHPDDRPVAEAAFAKATQPDSDGVYHVEKRVVWPNGPIHWIVTQGQVLFAESEGVRRAVRMVGVVQDITERKLAEEELRRAHETLALAQQVSHSGVWDWDIVNNQTFWSPEYYELYGIAPETTPGHDAWMAAIHPDDRARIDMRLREVLDVYGDWNEEFRIVHPERGERWLVGIGRVNYDEEGQPVRFTGINLDITERKAAEAQLHYQANLLENVGDAIISTDLDFRIRTWNRGAERTYGWTAEEAIGQRVSDLLSTVYVDEATEAEGVLQTFMQEGRWQGEVIHPHKDGTPTFISNITMLLRDEAGNPMGAVAVNRDITAQKEAEAVLTRYQLLSEQARDIILFLQLDGQIVEANAAATKAYGYDRETLLGMRIHDLRAPETQSQAAAQLAEAAQEESGRGIRFETLHRRHDESTFPVEVSSVGANVGDERLLVSVIRDISDRKAAEAALAASEAKFATAFSLSPLILTITSMADGRLVDVNESFVRLTGYSREEALGRTPDELNLWVNPEERTAGLARLAKDETIENVEAIFRMKHGEHRICLLGGTVVELDGKPFALTALTDITERKAAEAALVASETQLRLVTENITGLVSYVDREECYRFVNAAYEQWFDQSRDQIIGRTIRECVGDAAYARIQPYVARAFAGERVGFESTLTYADGITRTVMVTYVPDGEQPEAIYGFYALVTDITDRKRAEERLRFLAEAGTILGSSLEYIATLDNVARIAVPGIADWCAIDLVDEAGSFQEGIIAHVDPNKIRWAEELRERYPIDLNAPIGAPNVIRTGQSEFYPEITDEMLRAAANNEEELTLLRSVGYRSVMIVPLKTHGRILGAITFVATESETRFTTDDLTMAEELAQRAAAAIGNAELYRTVQQREQELRISEERFRAVQQATPDGFMIFESIRDDAGTIVDFRWLYVNPAAEAILGRSHADLSGRRLLEEMPGNREEGIFDAYVQVVESGEVWQWEFPYQHEGLDHWFRTTAAKTGDGFAVAFTDITPNKQAEAALRASEERFRSAFEQAAVGMAHLEPTGAYLRVNDRLCEILGYSREELLQKSFMEITHPDDLEADLEQTRRQLAGEIAHHSMEKRYIRKDGSYFWANMTASVVRDEAGAPKYGIVVVEDISARRQAEEELRRLNATLEERVAERTAELERSNQDLDQFAYVASHDLKAPLRGIDSLASWISEDAGAFLPEQSKGHLAKLQSRVQRMEQLLEDLLTYSRVGRRDGQVETVETGRLMRDVVELIAAPSGFTITIDEAMPTIRTPRAPLELVFRNLIGNAIKHHDQPEHGEIRISAQEQGEWVAFTITDNGPGIDPTHHTRIFNMFQTLRPRDQVEGSGMGLAIVQRAVELRGGTISVESSLGSGATFTFTWPKESR